MSEATSATLECLIPGDPDTRTGGYRYDARLIAGLRESGLSVRVTRLSDRFPFPDAAALAEADAMLSSLPAGVTVLIDGLAFGALGEVASRHASRLRLIALVHHPLALETGLSPDQAAALQAGERHALGCASRVLVTSRTTASSVAALGVAADRITVAEPGCDPAPLARGSSRARPQDAPPPCRLLCVATLTPRKGHDVLIEALARLQARRLTRLAARQDACPAASTSVPASAPYLRRPPRQSRQPPENAPRPDGVVCDWRLSCVGSTSRDPEAAARAARLCKRHGLDDRIVFCGEVDETERDAQYASADLFVCASWWEGYGMAVAEALARGLPVITTTGGALEHTAPESASLRVAPGDVDGLSLAIERFLDDATLRQRLLEGARQARRNLPRWADTVGIVRAMLAGAAP